MMKFRTALRFAVLVLAGVGAAGPLLAAEPKIAPRDLEFFEGKIRPILADHCYKCHSQGAEKIKGGLVLDSRDGWRKGGDTGPAIVPGDPNKSLLIRAVRYTDKDLQMPPGDRQLTPAQVADLEAWVKLGAPDPRTGSDARHDYKLDVAKAKAQHWAYRPVAKPAVPAVDDAQGWAQSPIDSFILEKLRAKGLSPSARADKVTLLRRASFDLIGLPPTREELNDFVADTSPNAFAKVVDRLLASPRYGERWGRHWLDVAKYGDTKGAMNQGRDPRYLFAWTYRDYVIRAFNEDLPYDQFLLQQIAADQLPSREDRRSLAALGFLTLGNRFNNNIHDIIDDRIDLIGKATLAMTLACARCHDHKFDPIPTKDYYSLYGVFASCTEPREGPLLVEPADTPEYRDFQNALTKAEAALEKFRDETIRKLAIDRLNQTAEILVALHDFSRSPGGLNRDDFIRKRGLSATAGRAWDRALGNWRRKHHPIFAPWLALEALDDAEFASRGRELAAKFAANNDTARPINPLVARMFQSAPVSLKQVAAQYEALFVDVDRQWHAALAAHEVRAKMAGATPPPAPSGLPDAATEEVRKFLFAANSPALLDEQRANELINRDDRLRNRQIALQRAINDLKATHRGSPPRAHVLADATEPRDTPVFIRGNPGQRGDRVPRRFLEVLSPENRAAFRQGSGRLELARAIANKDNPLTARVMVNRIWLHHFGDGLVDTPDDFGTRSEPPTHPELLDWLAATFVENGWSVKKLHRLIMLSAVYQQNSEDNPRFAQIDPNNQFYWQMNRRRLDFESLRDTLLFLGGKLDLTMGGPPVRLNTEPYARRRSVYGLVDRNALPNMLLTFDFANPDLSTGRREQTVVPQQALFLMNNPLVVEQARDLVRRADFKALTQERERLQWLYQLIYQRAPSEVETRLALDYLRGENASRGGAAQVGQTAWEYGYGKYDPQAKRVTNFVRMTQFENNGWQPTPQPGRPRDNKLAGLRLTADGGHPANEYAVIRRWTAPRDGVVAIDGVLGHAGKDGDGVRGMIVSSSGGLLGNWPVRQINMSTRLPRVPVQAGDTLDFFVAPGANNRGDAFSWAPVLRLIETPVEAGQATQWDAKKEFQNDADADRLGGWEKFAQVLLETNELMFVN